MKINETNVNAIRNSVVKALSRFTYNDVNEFEKVEYSNWTLYNPICMMNKDDEGYALTFEDEAIILYKYLRETNTMELEDLRLYKDINNRDELMMIIMRMVTKRNI